MKNDERLIIRLPKLLKKMATQLDINMAETCRDAIRKEVMRISEGEVNAGKKSKRND